MTSNALFHRPEAYALAVNAQFSQPAEGNYALKLTCTGKVNTLFARLLGQHHQHQRPTSSVLWASRKLNLALVLDNTGLRATEPEDDQPQDRGA